MKKIKKPIEPAQITTTPCPKCGYTVYLKDGKIVELKKKSKIEKIDMAFIGPTEAFKQEEQYKQMKNYKSEIIFRDINIKSINKLRLLSSLLEQIEEEVCVGTTKITIENSFICPDINIEYFNETPMQEVIQEIVKKIRKQ